MSTFTPYQPQGSKRPRSPVSELPFITFLSEASEPSSKRVRFAEFDDSDDDLDQVDQLMDDTENIDSTNTPQPQTITIFNELHELQAKQGNSFLHIQDPKQALERPRFLPAAPCNPVIPPPAPISKEVALTSLTVEGPTDTNLAGPEAVIKRHRFHHVNGVGVLKTNLRHLIEDVKALRIKATLSLNAELGGSRADENALSNSGTQNEAIVIDSLRNDAISQTATQDKDQQLCISQPPVMADGEERGLQLKLPASDEPLPAQDILPSTTMDSLSTTTASNIVQDSNYQEDASAVHKIENFVNMNNSDCSTTQNHFALQIFDDELATEEEREKCLKSIQQYEKDLQKNSTQDDAKTVCSLSQQYHADLRTTVAQLPAVDIASNGTYPTELDHSGALGEVHLKQTDLVVPETPQIAPQDLTGDRSLSSFDDLFNETGSPKLTTTSEDKRTDHDLADLHSNTDVSCQVGMTNPNVDLPRDGVDGSNATRVHSQTVTPACKPRKQPEEILFNSLKTRTHKLKEFGRGDSIYQGCELLPLGSRGGGLGGASVLPFSSGDQDTKHIQHRKTGSVGEESVLKITKNINSPNRKSENTIAFKDYTKRFANTIPRPC